jgi:hypothetical protein
VVAMQNIIALLGSLVTISSAKNQCIILAEFHDDTSKEGLWHHACGDGWGVANDCCKWNPAITCDANGQVVALNLRGCGIKGQLGQLLTIPTLVNVSLDSNSLYGPLPTDMSSAKALRSISAYGNTLSGVLDSLKAASSLGDSRSPLQQLHRGAFICEQFDLPCVSFACEQRPHWPNPAAMEVAVKAFNPRPGIQQTEWESHGAWLHAGTCCYFPPQQHAWFLWFSAQASKTLEGPLHRRQSIAEFA